MTTQVEPFDDSASVESVTSPESDDADMTQINFSTGSISLIIQTVPAGASIMVNCILIPLDNPCLEDPRVCRS